MHFLVFLVTRPYPFHQRQLINRPVRREVLEGVLNQTKGIMKTKFRILLIIGVAVALIAAGVPVINSGKGWTKKNTPCYSQEEVRNLMRLNSMSQKEAEEVLALSCEFAVRPE
jgi:hypothetical protein